MFLRERARDRRELSHGHLIPYRPACRGGFRPRSNPSGHEHDERERAASWINVRARTSKAEAMQQAKRKSDERGQARDHARLSGAQWNDFIGEQMRGTPRVLTVERE
jgi:hypothetical protein